MADQTDPRGQSPSDQQYDQKDFRRKVRDTLNALRTMVRARERAFSGNVELSEGAQEDHQAPVPKGL